MARVQLSTFKNDSYHPGRSFVWQLAWFFFGLPLLRCGWIPFSGLRARLLRAFGASVGASVVIKPGVRVKYPWRLTIGDHCWIGEDCWIDNIADVRLGNDVCLSQASYLCTGNHDWSDPAFRLIEQAISIGDGAWIGARAVVCPGVEIGKGAVLAAGSIANRRVTANEIHAGNPARFVRERKLREPGGDTYPPAVMKEHELVCESYS